VVSKTSHRLIPSIPTRYCRPMLGTQDACSTIWKPGSLAVNRPSTTSDAAKVASVATSAIHRAPRSLTRGPASSRPATPTRGRKITIVSR